MDADKLTTQFLEIFRDQVEDMGDSLKVTVGELASYMTQRASMLAVMLASSEPGFDLALLAERDNVALFAGVKAVEKAREMDNRLIGMIHGALAIASTVLVQGAIEEA